MAGNFSFNNAQAPVRQRGEGYGSSIDITDAAGIKNYLAEKITDFESKPEGKHPWIKKRYGSWYVSAHIGEFTVWWDMDENKKGGQYMPVDDEADGRAYLNWVNQELNNPEAQEIWERAATAFEGYKEKNKLVAVKAAELFEEATGKQWEAQAPDGKDGAMVYANRAVRGAWAQKARNRMGIKNENFYWDETVVAE